MDVTMGKKTVVCYHKVFEYSDLCESAVESVVPDTMPDIERILCADGTLVIKSKEVAEGSASVTAGIAASVLYVPEGMTEVRCLKAAIPFSFNADAPGVSPDSLPTAAFTIDFIEARMQNPRKVVIRAGVTAAIACYDHAEAEYCSGATGESADEIQQLVESRVLSHVVFVGEKTFFITDDFRIPAGSPRVGELLANTVELSAEDIKTVGSKIVVNGTAKTTLTYAAAESGEIASVTFETAFSQLMEVDRELAAPECTVGLLLTAVFVEPHGFAGEEAGISCELHAVVQMVCSDSAAVDYLSDCYSNRRHIEAAGETVPVVCDVRRVLQRCGFHEALETDRGVNEVRAMFCRAAGFKVADGNITCRLTVNVVYVDDDGAAYCASGQFPMTCPAGLEAGMTGAVISACCTQAYASPAQKSVDLRVQVCFDMMAWRDAELAQITGIDLAEEPLPKSKNPSIVVVRAEEGATLWMLAKRYRSTCGSIRAANHLEEGESLIGKILLIPASKI
jgi:hypothetical protein